MTERAGWDPDSESVDTDLVRSINEHWNSPFEGQTEDDPVTSAAEAIWAVHTAEVKQSEDEKHGLGRSIHPEYGFDELYEQLLARKDTLLERLSSVEERDRAFGLAEQVIGHVEDPEAPFCPQTMLEDLGVEVQRARDGKLREIGEE